MTVSEATTSKRTEVGFVVVAEPLLERCKVLLSEGLPYESRTVTVNVVGKPAVDATRAMTDLLNVVRWREISAGTKCLPRGTCNCGLHGQRLGFPVGMRLEKEPKRWDDRFGHCSRVDGSFPLQQQRLGAGPRLKLNLDIIKQF
jgi:hypothetical protein